MCVDYGECGWEIDGEVRVEADAVDVEDGFVVLFCVCGYEAEHGGIGG